MTIRVLETRHCEAAPAAVDLDRVLTEAGEKAAQALGQLPVFQEFVGAPLFGSEAIRTRQTLAKAFDYPVEQIPTVVGLYPDPTMHPGKTLDEIYAKVKHAPLRAYLDAEGGKAAVRAYGYTAANAILDELYGINGDRAAFAWHGALIQSTICMLCESSNLSVPDVVMNVPLEPGDGFLLEFNDDLLLTRVEHYNQ